MGDSCSGTEEKVSQRNVFKYHRDFESATMHFLWRSKMYPNKRWHYALYFANLLLEIKWKRKRFCFVFRLHLYIKFLSLHWRKKKLDRGLHSDFTLIILNCEIQIKQWSFSKSENVFNLKVLIVCKHCLHNLGKMINTTLRNFKPQH